MIKRFPNGSQLAVQNDHDNIVIFSGVSDRMTFIFPTNDTIIANGRDQELNLAKASGVVNVFDWGKSLDLGLSGMVFGKVNVYNIQNDISAKVINTAGGHVSHDAHGCTQITGMVGGGAVEFVGARHVAILDHI